MEKEWKEMSAEERQEARFNRWLSPENIKFESPETEASYKANITRLKDVVQLKKTPDRVPIFPFFTFMPANLYGVKTIDIMNDPRKLVSTWKSYLEDYAPDFYISPALVGSSKCLEALDYKQYKWPGHGVSDNSPYQMVESEYMKEDEYSALIDDPSDFWLRTYLPRMCGALEPLKAIGPFTDIWEMPIVSGHFIGFGTPEVQSALKALMEAGREAFEWGMHIIGFEAEAQGKGFVNGAGGISKAPFDIIGDTLRGSRGMIRDMYRQPDMVLKALEKITPLAIKQGLGGANFSGNPIVFMPLHKGADGFMSDEQFKTFYWPTLKEVIVGLINEGCVPLIFAEGGYNSRLEYLNELPKGHCIWLFDRTDMTKAKEVVGGTTCIAGNVPAGMILTGTPDKVKEYCKDLIDVAGKDGGYIMSCGTSMDEGKPDTLHAMIDFTKEYGVY